MKGNLIYLDKKMSSFQCKWSEWIRFSPPRAPECRARPK